MLDKQDIELLQGAFDQSIGKALKQNNHDLKRDIRDEMHSLIAAAITASEHRIISTICGFIDDSILPQIAELQTDHLMIKRRLKFI